MRKWKLPLSEDNEYVSYSFTIRAGWREKEDLKKLSYTVGQWLVYESNVDHLILPKILQSLVKKFINLYSGDYIIRCNK